MSEVLVSFEQAARKLKATPSATMATQVVKAASLADMLGNRLKGWHRYTTSRRLGRPEKIIRHSRSAQRLLHYDLAAECGARHPRPHESIAMQRHMSLQSPVNRLAHQVMLGIARLDAGRMDGIGTAFRTLDIGQDQPPSLRVAFKGIGIAAAA